MPLYSRRTRAWGFSGTASQFTCLTDISINCTRASRKIQAVWRGKLNIECRNLSANRGKLSAWSSRIGHSLCRSKLVLISSTRSVPRLVHALEKLYLGEDCLKDNVIHP